MQIKSISISERASYERRDLDRAEYKASITLRGGSQYPSDITISIPEEMLLPILAIIQQATAEAMARSAEEFRQSVEAALMAPAIEVPALEAGDDNAE